jgi:hypothetical protein
MAALNTFMDISMALVPTEAFWRLECRSSFFVLTSGRPLLREEKGWGIKWTVTRGLKGSILEFIVVSYVQLIGCDDII